MITPRTATSIIKGLKDLINKPDEGSDAIEYFAQVLPGFGGAGVGAPSAKRTDRGVAILIAVKLELSLQNALEKKAKKVRKHSAQHPSKKKFKKLSSLN